MNAPATPASQTHPRRRVAVGPARPRYMQDAETDRLSMIVTALAAEVSALRDRLATHEALAREGTLATPEAIETYRPSAEQEAGREAARLGMLKRVYRVVTEELDEVRQGGDGNAAPRGFAMPEGWDKT